MPVEVPEKQCEISLVPIDILLVALVVFVAYLILFIKMREGSEKIEKAVTYVRISGLVLAVLSVIFSAVYLILNVTCHIISLQPGLIGANLLAYVLPGLIGIALAVLFVIGLIRKKKKIEFGKPQLPKFGGVRVVVKKPQERIISR